MYHSLCNFSFPLLSDCIGISLHCYMYEYAGYQRELIFQLFSGAFAVWPGGVPSVW